MAGLPNITGTLGDTGTTNWVKGFANSKVASGAFEAGIVQNKKEFTTFSDTTDNCSGFSFNASRSSSIYGSSSTVTPLSESTLLCIRY